MRIIVKYLGVALVLGLSTLAGCKVKKLAQEVELKDHNIENQLFVQLTEMDKQEQLKSDFDKYGLVIIQEISSQLKMVHIQFDTDAISPEEMMVRLELEDYVTNANFANESSGK